MKHNRSVKALKITISFEIIEPKVDVSLNNLNKCLSIFIIDLFLLF